MRREILQFFGLCGSRFEVWYTTGVQGRGNMISPGLAPQALNPSSLDFEAQLQDLNADGNKVQVPAPKKCDAVAQPNHQAFNSLRFRQRACRSDDMGIVLYFNGKMMTTVICHIPVFLTIRNFKKGDLFGNANVSMYCRSPALKTGPYAVGFFCFRGVSRSR